jgi:hypothetical protein
MRHAGVRVLARLASHRHRLKPEIRYSARPNVSLDFPARLGANINRRANYDAWRRNPLSAHPRIAVGSMPMTDNHGLAAVETVQADTIDADMARIHR